MKLTLLRGFLIFFIVILLIFFPSSNSLAINPFYSSNDDSFDWRDHGYDFAVHDQGDCNAGYAFAAVDAVQSAIWKKDGRERYFSVNHAKECNWHAIQHYVGLPNTCEGGNFKMLTNLFSQQGLVLESCDPYLDEDVACNLTCDPQYFITDWQQFSSSYEQASVEFIKQKLIELGPLYTQMDAKISGFETYSGEYVLTGTSTDPNKWTHGVLLVGWDDDLGSGGAWVVKNSYGSQWGDEGYFYIAYRNAGIGSSLATVTGWQENSSFNNIQFYDEAGHTMQMSPNSQDFRHGKALGKFNLQENEIPQAIEFWTHDASVVNIQIYDQFSGNELSSLLYQSGPVEIMFPGYHQIIINPGFDIPEDQEIFIQLEVTNNSRFFPIVVDGLGTLSDDTWYQDENGVWQTLFDKGFDAGIRLRSIVLPVGLYQQIFLPMIYH